MTNTGDNQRNLNVNNKSPWKKENQSKRAEQIIIIHKNCPQIKRKKGMRSHIERALCILEEISPEWLIPRHIPIKLLDFKEKKSFGHWTEWDYDLSDEIRFSLDN